MPDSADSHLDASMTEFFQWTRRAAIIGGCGALFSACGSKTRTRVVEKTVAVPANPVTPAEPVEGRLVYGYYKAHPELRYSIQPIEPFAPRGRWKTQSWGELWIPNWLDVDQNKLSMVEQEIQTTVPGWEVDTPLPLLERGPRSGTRLIITDPGPFSATYEGGPPADFLAWGLFGNKAWPGALDVIWCGFSIKELREWSGAPLALKRWLPALGHELAHQYTGNLTHELGEVSSMCQVSS